MSADFDEIPQSIRWFLWTRSPASRKRIQSGKSTWVAELTRLKACAESANDLFERELSQLSDGMEIHFRESPNFPVRLNRLGTATPECIYTKGELLEGRRIAVVGSRGADAEGIRLTQRLVKEIAPHATIVSGGAIGVDAAAHQACLDVGAHTAVVLPCGLDKCAPSRHRALFAEVTRSGGVLVSEERLGTGVRKFSFRRRNQILVALSDSVLVVRSKTRGGTMVSAGFATDLNIPLYAVPGSPEDVCSLGCLELILSGAASPIWKGEQLGLAAEKMNSPKVHPELQGVVAKVYTSIGLKEGLFAEEDISIDLRAHVISACFNELEVRGLIRKSDETDKWRIVD